MASIKKGIGIFNGCLLSVSGLLIAIFSLMGLFFFPGFGFSAITAIVGFVFIFIGLYYAQKASEYKDWSNSSVKSHSEVDENTSFEEMQEIIKRRGW